MGWERKDRVALNRNLIYVRVERGALRGAIIKVLK
jgi:hypothetical protein